MATDRLHLTMLPAIHPAMTVLHTAKATLQNHYQQFSTMGARHNDDDLNCDGSWKFCIIKLAAYMPMPMFYDTRISSVAKIIYGNILYLLRNFFFFN